MSGFRYVRAQPASQSTPASQSASQPNKPASQTASQPSSQSTPASQPAEQSERNSVIFFFKKCAKNFVENPSLKIWIFFWQLNFKIFLTVIYGQNFFLSFSKVLYFIILKTDFSCIMHARKTEINDFYYCWILKKKNGFLLIKRGVKGLLNLKMHSLLQWWPTSVPEKVSGVPKKIF